MNKPTRVNQIDQYLDPLSNIDSMLVSSEKRRQLKRGIILALTGIALFALTITISSLNNPDTSNGREGFGGIWEAFILYLITYGVYRIARFRHYTRESFRDQLVKDSNEVMQLDSEIRQRKLNAKNNKWYNKQVFSDSKISGFGKYFAVITVFVCIAVVASMIVILMFQAM